MSFIFQCLFFFFGHNGSTKLPETCDVKSLASLEHFYTHFYKDEKKNYEGPSIWPLKSCVVITVSWYGNSIAGGNAACAI